MIRLAFLVALIGALGATIILVVRRPVKLLAIIQLILAALVVVVFIAELKTALWLHSMPLSNPIRQTWQPRLDKVGAILWFVTIISWLAFTLFHLIFVARRNPSD